MLKIVALSVQHRDNSLIKHYQDVCRFAQMGDTLKTFRSYYRGVD